MHFSVSVIIPVYNAAPYLRDAVESALIQPEVAEVLLVEDGSHDDSLAICRELEAAHTTIKVHRHRGGSNLGAAATRNAGIALAGSPFISFLDADDTYLPGRFAQAAAIFELHPEVHGVYEAIGMIPTELAHNKPQLTTVNQQLQPEELFYKISPIGSSGYFSLSGLTVRKVVFDRCGLFNDMLRVSQDTEWMLRLVATCTLLPGKIDEPVSLRRIHSANRSTQEEYLKQFKPRMAMASLNWFARNGQPVNKVNEVLRLFLKYHFEWVHLYAGKGRIWRKWQDVRAGIMIWIRYPRLRNSKWLVYHLRLTFHLPVPKHLNYYEPAG